MGYKATPHKRDIIELWHAIDGAKPGYAKFQALCEDKGWSVAINVLKQWRMRGMLPGEMETKSRNPKAQVRSVGSIANEVIYKANRDAKRAEKDDLIYSKEMLREVAAKTMRCAEAFVMRLTQEAIAIKIETPADLAIVANLAMTVMSKAAEVTETMSLLVKSESPGGDDALISFEDARARLMGGKAE